MNSRLFRSSSCVLFTISVRLQDGAMRFQVTKTRFQKDGRAIVRDVTTLSFLVWFHLLEYL